MSKDQAVYVLYCNYATCTVNLHRLSYCNLPWYHGYVSSEKQMK